MRITSAHIKELCIYTGLTLGGLLVDLGIANLFVYFFSFPLVVSGIFGLIAGTITNYFIHLKITFKNRDLAPSWKGFLKYVQTCLVGAAVRVSILAIFGSFFNIPPMIALIVATGLSFTVNYLLSRFYVFRPHN